jgi:hypothetical protein
MERLASANLCSKDIEFDKIYFDWNKIEKAERYFDGEIYLSLIESYKSRCFFEDADDCYYIYRMERRCEMPTPYKPFDWILCVSYGYGVRPIRPLIWVVIVFIVFTLFYATTPGAIGITKAFSPIDAFNTSLTILLSGSQSIATPDYPASGMLPYWIFTLEKLLGSLFLALFLISIGRTIIRSS